MASTSTRPGPRPPRSGRPRAAGSRRIESDPAARLDDPVLLRHLIWTGIDSGLPVQFHVGFGDTDVRLHRSDPSLLHDFLLATRRAARRSCCCTATRITGRPGYLANVFPHVYMDLGAILNHVGARSAAVLAEALELTPFHKMLYSSDAFGLPELHYLGAIGFRRDCDRVIGGFVADGDWSAADARRVAHMIGSENAARVYRLELRVSRTSHGRPGRDAGGRQPGLDGEALAARPAGCERRAGP